MKNRIRYTVEQVSNSLFYQMPKFLFSEEFAELSNDARVLYMLLKDRHELSVKNQWYNDKQEVYLIMKREEMELTLNLSAPTIRKAINELKELNLIEEERQGLNKPNLIYLLECQNLTVRTVKNLHSRPKEFYSQDVKKFSPINTNLNHTNLSKTYSINQNDTIDLNSINDRLGIENLKLKYPDKQNELQELYDIIFETLSSRKKTMRIAKEDMPVELVKRTFAMLDYSHIEYVLGCLSKNTTAVKSTKSYLQTALFNAPKTINNHYALDSQQFLYDNLGVEPE